MTSKLPVSPTKLSVLIATVLGVHVGTSYASLLNYNIVTESGYAIGQSAPLTYNSVDSNPTYAASSLEYGTYNSDPHTRGAARGDDLGWMYSRSGGQGSYFSHYSVVTQNVELQNNSGSAQYYNYNFAINFGSLSAYDFGFTNATEYSTAGYEVVIAVNNVALWQSAFVLQTNQANGTLGSGTGTTLASYAIGESYFSWPEYFSNLDLGLLNIGQSLQLSYSIKTFVAGNHATSCYGYGDVPSAVESQLSALTADENCDGGYGEYGGMSFNGDTYAQFGDPNGFNSTPVMFKEDSFTARAQGVAAPGTLALAGLGLAGLAFRRRKPKV